METVELVHAEAQRLLSQQADDLTIIRTRAVAILSAAGVINGLFGVKVASGHHPAPQWVFIGLALAAFAIMAACVIAVEWPQTFSFTEHVDQWLHAIREGEERRPLDYLYHFARRYTEFRALNKPKIARLYELFTAACVLLGVQVLCWGVSVGLA